MFYFVLGSQSVPEDSTVTVKSPVKTLVVILRVVVSSGYRIVKTDVLRSYDFVSF